MREEEKFIAISSLVCEPARAKMLWNLLDGRAYTASELAAGADISPTSASNHLAKLLEADLLKVESQGRHRYFSFARPEVAYVVESLASLANYGHDNWRNDKNKLSPIKYCRTCYDHLAGYVGVKITEGLKKKRIIATAENGYRITNSGWKWLADFGITKNELLHPRRPIAKQCLDWSERKPHVSGMLGALLLDKVLENKWVKTVQFSRELVVTSVGKEKMEKLFDIMISE